MNILSTLPAMLLVGTVGGCLGVKCKLPAGALVGSLVAVICFKLIAKVDWQVPKALPLAIQVWEHYRFVNFFPG